MNRYIVGEYTRANGRLHDLPARTIEAPSAMDAVIKAASEAGCTEYASITARWQQAGDEAVRDNAHLQADWHGYRGWHAIRVEAAEKIRLLDEKADELFGRGAKVKRGHDRVTELNAYVAEICGTPCA